MDTPDVVVQEYWEVTIVAPNGMTKSHRIPAQVVEQSAIPVSAILHAAHHDVAELYERRNEVSPHA